MNENLTVKINIPKNKIKAILFLVAENCGAEADDLQALVDNTNEIELVADDFGDEARNMEMGLSAIVLSKLMNNEN